MQNIIILFFYFFISFSASADVTLDIIDLHGKITRITNTINYNKEGIESAIFPSKGYKSFNKSLKVISAFEMNTEQEIDTKIIEYNDKNYKSIELSFPNPIPKGGNYKIKLSVEGVTKNITQDKDGRYVFKYSTSGEVFFVLPEGHAIVYSNYPVLVYEKKKRTVVQIKGKNNKNIIIKSRAFSNIQDSVLKMINNVKDEYL